MSDQQQTKSRFEVIVHFLRWWRHELSELLPASVRRLWSTARTSLHVFIQQDSVIYRKYIDGNEADTETDLGSLQRECTPVIVHVPEAMVLTRQMQLPAAARENLYQVLGFEMDRHTPFKSDQVYYAFDTNKANSNKDTIDVSLSWVIKANIDQALSALSDWKLHEKQTELDKQTGEVRIRLHSGEYSSAAVRRSGLLPIAVSMSLLLAIIVLPFWKQNEHLQELQAELDKMTQNASSAEQLQANVDTHAALLQYIYQKQQASPGMLKILNELSQLIPDSTWVKRLDVRNSVVHIQGESTEASSLIGVLESADSFSNVRFESPVTQDSIKQVENFQIAMDIDTDVINAGAVQ